MTSDFWKNKKVFITGHTGFKGSWLSLWLQELGAEVIGFSLEPSTAPNLFTVAAVEKNMKSYIGDIRDFDALKRAISDTRPDIIFHMAAQSLVRYSYDYPIDTYAVNVMGTVNLFEAVRQVGGCKAIVNITSDKCYENKEWHWGYREHDVLGGHDPYSNSKACAELVTASFRDSFFKAQGCGLASVRAGNVIGGGDWALDRLIPDLMRSLINEKVFSVRYPHALRPWQHVLEPLHGYLLVAEQLYQAPSVYAESWNFGPEENDVKPVEWIIKKVQQFWKANLTSQYDANAVQRHEATYLKLDSSKAKSKLGWKPNWDLEKALAQTVDWYQAYARKSDMHQKTCAQIKKYTSLQG